ncbi:bile acid:sodium symporter family protein [Actinomycetaceae bacterium L2_0104]
MKWRPDPLVTGIIVAMILGLVLHLPQRAHDIFSVVADLSVATVFLVYGMRIRTRDVIDGLRNVKLQGLVLAATYVLFPALGFAIGKLVAPWLGTGFATGFLYLSLLPSTIQSSVTFVSIARGNVAAAVCAATISNIVGIFITPVLVLLFLNISGASGDDFLSVFVLLLLPFILGQLIQPKVGAWWRAHRRLVRVVDNTSIILIVFSAVLGATAAGAWHGVTVWTILLLLALSGVLLALLLTLTWWGGKLAGLNRADRIVLLMCGSKKSLASGLPMAKALFPAGMVGSIIVPVVIFHQLQLFVCAILARHLGLTADPAETPEG